MTKKPAAKKRSRVDWDAIEPHYRAGIRALKDIGAEFDVSDAGIIKHAREKGWTRNLKAKIQARADAKVSAAMVSAEVSPQAKLTEAVRIEVESQVQARVRLTHRADIGKSRELAMRLLAELEHQTGSRELYDQLFELLTDPNGDGEDMSDAAKERQRKRREAFDRALSLANRTKTMKDLADTLKTLITLEREAFGIIVEKPRDSTPNENLTDADLEAALEAHAKKLGLTTAQHTLQ